MSCYHPLFAIRDSVVNPETGLNSIVIIKGGAKMAPARLLERAGGRELLQLPCGNCIGCRLDRSRTWAIRCVHEADSHDANCFITLTFNEYFMPSDESLCKDDFVKFMKRLRKMISPRKVRFFHCGEYGTVCLACRKPMFSVGMKRGEFCECKVFIPDLGRPHHHACLFGYDFPDKVLWSVRNGVKLYRSEMLEKLWPFGYCTVGDVTYESAAYVARYVVKKINGEKAEAHYRGKLPEYITMSRRGGIGERWYYAYVKDMYPADLMVWKNGKKVCKPPRYYDEKFKLTNSEDYERMKKLRKEQAEANPDNQRDRLAVRESIKLAKAKQLRRVYETSSF